MVRIKENNEYRAEQERLAAIQEAENTRLYEESIRPQANRKQSNPEAVIQPDQSNKILKELVEEREKNKVLKSQLDEIQAESAARDRKFSSLADENYTLEIENLKKSKKLSEAEQKIKTIERNHKEELAAARDAFDRTLSVMEKAFLSEEDKNRRFMESLVYKKLAANHSVQTALTQRNGLRRFFLGPRK